MGSKTRLTRLRFSTPGRPWSCTIHDSSDSSRPCCDRVWALHRLCVPRVVPRIRRTTAFCRARASLRQRGDLRIEKKRLINRASNWDQRSISFENVNIDLRLREGRRERIVEWHFANRSSTLYPSNGSDSFAQIPFFLPSFLARKRWMDFYLVDRCDKYNAIVMGL